MLTNQPTVGFLGFLIGLLMVSLLSAFFRDILSNPHAETDSTLDHKLARRFVPRLFNQAILLGLTALITKDEVGPDYQFELGLAPVRLIAALAFCCCAFHFLLRFQPYPEIKDLQVAFEHWRTNLLFSAISLAGILACISAIAFLN